MYVCVWRREGIEDPSLVVVRGEGLVNPSLAVVRGEGGVNSFRVVVRDEGFFKKKCIFQTILFYRVIIQKYNKTGLPPAHDVHLSIVYFCLFVLHPSQQLR